MGKPAAGKYLIRILHRVKGPLTANGPLTLLVEWEEDKPTTYGGLGSYLSIGGEWESGDIKAITQSVAFTAPDEITIIVGDPSYE